jgi:hypothetical protein
MHRLFTALLFGLCVVPLFGQSPSDLSFTLVAKDRRTTFRMGEPIILEFRFSSSTPGTYEVHALSDKDKNHFFSDPADGAVDPLADFQIGGAGGRGSAPPGVFPLNGAPVVLEREMNGWWLSFRRTGHYRITAESEIVTLAGQGRAFTLKNPIHLRSNSMEVEIVAPEPAWLEDRIRAAIGPLDQWRPEAAARTAGLVARGNSFPTIAAIDAAQALALLDTRESALQLARLVAREWPAEIRMPLEYGVRRSPYRREIIASLERSLEAPDVAVTDYWMGLLTDLAAVSNSRPPDFAKSYRYYYDRLAAMVNQKVGHAKDVSLKTLENRSPY